MPVTRIGEVCRRCLELGRRPAKPPRRPGDLCTDCWRQLGKRGRVMWRAEHGVDSDPADD